MILYLLERRKWIYLFSILVQGESGILFWLPILNVSLLYFPPLVEKYLIKLGFVFDVFENGYTLTFFKCLYVTKFDPHKVILKGFIFQKAKKKNV